MAFPMRIDQSVNAKELSDALALVIKAIQMKHATTQNQVWVSLNIDAEYGMTYFKNKDEKIKDYCGRDSAIIASMLLS